MKMVHRSDIPKYRKIKYSQFVCDYITHKGESNQSLITVVEDRVAYPGDVSTKTAYLMTIKCLLNSVSSKFRLWFMTADV